MVSTLFQDLLIHGASFLHSQILHWLESVTFAWSKPLRCPALMCLSCLPVVLSREAPFFPFHATKLVPSLGHCPVRCPAFWIRLGFSLYVWGGFLLSPQALLLGRQEAAQGDWGHVQYPWSMEMNYRGGLSMLTRTRVH